MRAFSWASTSAMATSCALAGGAGHQLHLAFGGLLADIDAIGNADQVGILELDSGALVAVIQQHVETGGFELGGELFAGAHAVLRRRRW